MGFMRLGTEILIARLYFEGYLFRVKQNKVQEKKRKNENKKRKTGGRKEKVKK